MTSAPVEPRPWAWRRWSGLVAFIFVVQLGLIFWLGSRTPISPRPSTTALTLRLDGQIPAELQALNDPTLFTLAHPEGFAGQMWWKIPGREFRPFEWSAPTNQFPLAVDRLGSISNRLFEGSEFPALPLPALPEASPTLPNVPALTVVADQSVLLLEDGLAQRRLLTPLEPKPCTNADILANSVVRVGVDDGGRPVSVTLLSGSGSPTADKSALDQAWAARFEPLRRDPIAPALKPTSHLTWGKMIFRWHTVPMPPASAAVASP
jgi:hypothetical protein